MIKTKLPLPPDRNPFQGHDYRVEDEDKALPRSDLWGYKLPEEQQYEYDIRRNPTLLLSALKNRVIIPQTKLTMLIIQWAACNFGLGEKVYCMEDIKQDGFWNADPPSTDLCEPWSDEDEGEGEDRESLAFAAYNGVAPYDALWQDEPTEDWIHARFCSVYPMHGWAHRSFVRVLLFNTFSGCQALPTYPQVMGAVHVANQLCSRLPSDILQYTEQFIIAHSFLEWQEKDTTLEPWDHDVFSKWTSEERGMGVIFVDAQKWIQENPLEYPSSFGGIYDFLTDPMRVCQDALDILSLPLIGEHQYPFSGEMNHLPDFDVDTCTCGECELIQSKLPANLESFRHQYFAITSSRPNECDALAKSWEPTMHTAEDWLDTLIARVESQFALFPWSEERRTGSAVLEIANMLRFQVGSMLSDQELLRFIVALSLITDTFPPASPSPPGPFGIGYIVKLPWAADREDYRIEDAPDYVMFATGGWMYDMVSINGVTLLHEREDLRIIYNTTRPGKFSAICMPDFRPDFAVLLPLRHVLDSTSVMPPSSRLSHIENDVVPETTIVLSDLHTDAFPLLSVSSPEYPAPKGALAALIRVEIRSRIIETVWKPSVEIGSPCEHNSLWRCMTHCSPTAFALIQQIPISSFESDSNNVPDSSLGKELDFLRLASDERLAYEQHLLKNKLNGLARLGESLTKPGSPLERNRVCIVRCGVNDGPVDGMVVLGALVRKKVYVLHYRECWDCALAKMQDRGCTVGIAIDTKQVTCCDQCV